MASAAGNRRGSIDTEVTDSRVGRPSSRTGAPLSRTDVVDSQPSASVRDVDSVASRSSCNSIQMS